MVFKVKVNGHNDEGQGRCDGVESYNWIVVEKKSSKIKDKIEVKQN